MAPITLLGSKWVGTVGTDVSCKSCRAASDVLPGAKAKATCWGKLVPSMMARLSNTKTIRLEIEQQYQIPHTYLDMMLVFVYAYILIWFCLPFKYYRIVAETRGPNMD